MRSKHASLFNHDDDAHDYDLDVSNEQNPIRAGYEKTLNWVIKRAQITSKCAVLDLGSGTGNLASRISACRQLVCVDVSQKMTELARPKLVHIKNLAFVIADILEYFDQKNLEFDAIISTYTIHHLVEEEKFLLFEKIWQSLKPGGRAVFGDLMLESASLQKVFIKKYLEMGRPDVASAISTEFFWHVDSATQNLKELGFEVERERLSDLSWGIAASKPL